MSILKNEDRADRIETLSANAYKKEVFSYFKKLSEDELDERKERYFSCLAKIDIAQAELDEAKAAFKESTAVPRQQANEAYTEIKNKGSQVSELVFLIVDHENDTVNYMNEEGEVVYTRRMYAEERQLKLSIAM